MLLAFYKPFRVLSQFSADGSSNDTLSGFGFPKNVYPLGRLDADSEGLLLLSDEAGLNNRLLDPSAGHGRTYQVQVEGIPDPAALRHLASGLLLQNHKTLPCRVQSLETEPEHPPRNPPIRFRKNSPTTWLEIELNEGKNRQVRRMTAAIGHPTLRLIRVRIGSLTLGNLAPGQWMELDATARRQVLGAC